MRRALAVSSAVLVALTGLVGLATAAAPGAQADALAIVAPVSGSFLQSGEITVSGTSTAGDEVQIGLDGGGDPLCIVAGGGSSTTWSCVVSVPDGAHTLRAVELLPDGSTTSATASVAVLSPPTIEVGDAGTAVSNGTVRGTAYPGASVTVTASNGAGCGFVADSGGSWACTLGGPLASGDYTASAVQSAPFAPGQVSAASAAVTLVVDAERPAAPILLSPVEGQTVPSEGAEYSGTGEDDALVSVFVDAGLTCEATVTGGAWACTGGSVVPGDHRVAVIQSDPAGNVSEGSGGIDVVFSDGTPTPSPVAPLPTLPGTDPPTGTPSSAPGTPGTTPTGPEATSRPDSPRPSSGAPTAPATTSPTARPAPGATSQGPAAPGATSTPGTSGSRPAAPGTSDARGDSGGGAPSGGGSPAPTNPGDTAPGTEGELPGVGGYGSGVLGGGWSDLTPMSAALIAAHATPTVPDWLRSLGLALASLALVVVPMRLATVGAAPRPASAPRRWRIAGRNRAAVEFDDKPDAPPLDSWIVTAIVLAATAGIALASSPVDSQPAYLRLLAGVLAAIVLVNAVAAIVPWLVARHLPGARLDGRVRIVPAPRALLLVGAAALLSRVVGLEPALLFGVVLGLSFSRDTRIDPVDLGKLAASRILALGALGVSAWLLAASIPASGGFLGLVATESLAATAIISLGSAAILLVPVGRPAGLAVLRWSPLAWLALSLVVYTMLFTVLAPAVAGWHATGAWIVIVPAAVGFAAVCVSIWAWRRYTD